MFLSLLNRLLAAHNTGGPTVMVALARQTREECIQPDEEWEEVSFRPFEFLPVC